MSSVLTNDKTAEPTSDEAAALEAAVRDIAAQIEQSNARMERDRVEIDRLQAETRVMLNSIAQTLSR
ncbi:MAG: hypothetical protein M3Y13_12950 [Armatimonadota bacterium]|nr:hypothetical protein [Armatimonadota bacterium]